MLPCALSDRSLLIMQPTYLPHTLNMKHTHEIDFIIFFEQVELSQDYFSYYWSQGNLFFPLLFVFYFFLQSIEK